MSNLVPRQIQQSAQGVVLLIDVGNRDSYDSISQWSKRIDEKFRSDVAKILVANKIDLGSKRTFETMDGFTLARSLGFTDYYEISVNYDINIEKPINDLLQHILYKRMEQAQKTEGPVEEPTDDKNLLGWSDEMRSNSTAQFADTVK